MKKHVFNMYTKEWIKFNWGNLVWSKNA